MHGIARGRETSWPKEIFLRRMGALPEPRARLAGMTSKVSMQLETL
jgi:hypothetical protein